MHETLSWIEAETGRRVVATRPLLGGLTSDVRAVTLDDSTTLVLRTYVSPDQDAARKVTNEAGVLRRLASTRIPAPRLVAARPTGTAPALLMTRVPGRVWLSARNHEDWLAQMVRTLCDIHDLPVDAAPRDPKSHVITGVEVPGWTTRPGLWARALSVIAQAPAAYHPAFTHDDYQHFNMIWSGKRLTGIIDWVFAGPGHPDADVAHCRLNLVLLYSVASAERFREMYEAEQGRRVDVWWDVREMTGYGPGWREFIPVQVARRAKVDQAGMDGRVEALMEKILARL